MVKAIDIKKHKINQFQTYCNSKFLSLCQTFDAGEGPGPLSPVLQAKILFGMSVSLLTG